MMRLEHDLKTPLLACAKLTIGVPRLALFKSASRLTLGLLHALVLTL